MKFQFIFAFILFMTSPHAFGYTINIVEPLEGKQAGRDVENLFTSVYSSIGIIPKFVYYPSKRGLNMVNSGELDAEAFRAEIVGESYEKLLKVDEVIDYIKVGFLCAKKEKCNADSNSVLAVLRGFRGALAICEKANINCTYVRTPAEIARLVDTGTVDAVFATVNEINFIVCVAKSPVLFFKQRKDLTLTAFHYINEKHLAIKDRLEKALTKLTEADSLAKVSPLSELLSNSCEKPISII